MSRHIQQVEKGMTPDDVRRALGPPHQTVRSQDTVRWMEYGTATHRFRLYFEEGMVQALPQ